MFEWISDPQWWIVILLGAIFFEKLWGRGDSNIRWSKLLDDVGEIRVSLKRMGLNSKR